jgi:Chitinase class I
MTFPLSPEIISEALGPWGPIVNVRANWPLVEAALAARGIYSDLTAVAAISTIGIETGSFAPVKERGGPAYLADLYEGRADLGNTAVGDGARFRGRGFVQITGRWDYTHFGKEIGQDLVGNPDLALDPRISADIFALFFHERGVPAYADAANWQMVRRRVNGGLAGWPRFMDAVTKLTAALKGPPTVGGESSAPAPAGNPITT